MVCEQCSGGGWGDACRNGRVQLLILALLWAGGARGEDRPTVAAPSLTAEAFRGALVRLEDDRLLNWWSSGERGEQHAWGRYSVDNGESWTPEAKLFAFPPDRGDGGTGYVSIADRSGGIHLFGLDYVGTGPAGFDDWKNSKSYIYHVRSQDQGAT